MCTNNDTGGNKEIKNSSLKQNLETEVIKGFSSQSPAFFVCEIWKNLNQTEREVLQYVISWVTNYSLILARNFSVNL